MLNFCSPSRDEKEESFVQVEVDMTVEMAVYKLVDLLLVHLGTACSKNVDRAIVHDTGCYTFHTQKARYVKTADQDRIM